MSDIDASIITDSPVTAQKNTRWQTIVACTYLIAMCVQYVPWEGYGVSPIKVFLMCLSPIFLLLCAPVFSSAMLWGGVYIIWIFLNMYLRFDNPRVETMGYSVMFFATYMLFYELVYHKKVFTADSFLLIVKVLLWSYIVVLIIQQVLSLGGLRELPLLNLYNVGDNSFKCQSLSLEPSHSARIIGALFFAYLKTSEYIKGTSISPKWLWQNDRSLLIGFMYSMLSMQSGTAIVILLILCLYFFHWKYIVFICLFLYMLPMILSLFESEQLTRVINVLEAFLTGNADQIIEADHSASYRVLSLLNLFHLDLFDSNTWFGYGTDTGVSNVSAGADSAKYSIAGGIQDYGLIAYIFSLLFVFRCCIRPFFSLATLIFFVTLGAGIGNIAYAWGILMIFTCVSFFHSNSINSESKQRKETCQTNMT